MKEHHQQRVRNLHTIQSALFSGSEIFLGNLAMHPSNTNQIWKFMKQICNYVLYLTDAYFRSKLTEYGVKEDIYGLIRSVHLHWNSLIIVVIQSKRSEAAKIENSQIKAKIEIHW